MHKSDFTNNRMHFDLYGVSLAAGQTVDAIVNQMMGSGNTDTEFTVTESIDSKGG
jgi:hypothetical protein